MGILLVKLTMPYPNLLTNVDDDWPVYVAEQKANDLQIIIAEERLKPEETQKFIASAFRDGVLKTTGTDMDKILPPISRFSADRAGKKQSVIEKLAAFFEKYFGVA